MMVNVSGALPVPPLFVALRITLEVPVSVGIPEICPVPASKVRPVGNPDAPKLVGELVAAI